VFDRCAYQYIHGAHQMSLCMPCMSFQERSIIRSIPYTKAYHAKCRDETIWSKEQKSYRGRESRTPYSPWSYSPPWKLPVVITVPGTGQIIFLPPINRLAQVARCLQPRNSDIKCCEPEKANAIWCRNPFEYFLTQVSFSSLKLWL